MIFAVPVNNLKDSSLNISLALSLAEELKSNPSDLNCMIIFLGAEYSNDSDSGYPIGADSFLLHISGRGYSSDLFGSVFRIRYRYYSRKPGGSYSTVAYPADNKFTD